MTKEARVRKVSRRVATWTFSPFASICVLRAGKSFQSNKFSRIQNVIWIKSLFQPPMHVTHCLAGRLWPPAFLCQTDPVFASNDTTPRQYLSEKIIERMLNFFAHGVVAIVSVRHDIDVNVAVAGMAEARDRKSVLCL